jgi:hypothetical protein
LVMMQGHATRPLRWWIWLGLIVPPVLGCVSVVFSMGYELPAMALIVTMGLSLVTIVVNQPIWHARQRTRSGEHTPAPVVAHPSFVDAPTPS